MKIKNYDQLELTYLQPQCASTRRKRRLTRAAFWFALMRQAVERAVDYAPLLSSRNSRQSSAPRPEQIWLLSPRPIQQRRGDSLVSERQ